MIKDWTKEELLELPDRSMQNMEREYSSSLVLNRSPLGSSNKRTAVIGVAKGTLFELTATQSEFVDWKMQMTMAVSENRLAREMTIRSVALIQSGVFHFSKAGARVRVAVFPD